VTTIPCRYVRVRIGIDEICVDMALGATEILRCRSTTDATVLAGTCSVRDRLEGGIAHRRGHDPADLVRPVLGVLDGHVARCRSDVAKLSRSDASAVLDPEARRGRSVLGR
jgi:hypothetical protein